MANPKQDENQNFSVFGISGTLGTSYGTSTVVPLTANATGALNIVDVVGNSLVPSSYDAIVPTFNSTSDVWVFKTGGTGGTTVSTLTISYTDATKQVMTSLVKT
jgi:hypothetical protein